MNLVSPLMRAAARYPHRATVSSEEWVFTYSEFDRAAATLGHAFLEAGLVRGDRVCLFAGNSDAYLLSLFAAWYAGLTAVPVNSRLHAAELDYILEHSGSRVLVSDQKVRDTIAALQSPPEIRFGIGLGEEVPDVRDLAAGQERLAGPTDVEPDDVAWIFYTSGTTGRPKGASLTHRNLLAMSMSMLLEVCDVTEEDRLLHLAPLSHASGLYAIPGIMRGAEHVIPTSFSFEPGPAMRTIEERRITVLPFLPPTMIVMLLGADQTDTSSLRRIVWGGAPMHIDNHRAALDRFGPILCQIYGQGEVPMTISVMPARLQPLPPELLQTAGRLFDGVEVAILDDDGSPVPAGEPGEICARGDVVMRGYWGDPDATDDAIRDGWMHTGDVGSLDEAGWLRLLERKKEVIISGGSNIYPREVEEALLRHPAVSQACVFGAEDLKWGEIVVAAVVLEDGAETTAEELIESCRDGLASFKKPSVVEFRDALPVSAYGKVLRRELAADFAERAKRAA